MKAAMRLFACAVLLGSLAWAQSPAVGGRPSSSVQTSGLLPDEFSGWKKQAVRTSTDVASLAWDGTAGSSKESPIPPAPLLKEYGFKDAETATFVREDRKITVRALRFSDATGAYGAFTFLKQPRMNLEKYGEQGASADTAILFYRGNVMVQASLDKVTAMSAAELRMLAEALPREKGNIATPPVLPRYLPVQDYLKNSAKLAEGPVGLEAIQSPIPASVVDFSKEAEVVLGRYASDSGIGTLVLISYPTPQIAAERLKAIEAWHAGSNSAQSQAAANPAAATPNGAVEKPSGFAAKRSGPMVVVAMGEMSNGEAKGLIGEVNYEAEVTWNENTGLSRRDNIGNLIVNAFSLIGILLGFMLVIGIAFGGIRIIMRKFFPGYIADPVNEVEFISLDLEG